MMTRIFKELSDGMDIIEIESDYFKDNWLKQFWYEIK